jgi:hypothetical protein
MTFDDVFLVGIKYRIKSFELTLGNEYKYQVSNKLILSMSIIEDYRSYIFPYFEIVFGLPTEDYRLLQKYSQNVKATLNLQKSKFKDAVTSNVDTAQAYKNCITNTFYVYFDDTTPDLSETEQKIVEKSENDYGAVSTVKALLYPYDYYTKYNLVVNASLKNVTVADVVTFCLNKCGITKVLMSPPTNCKRYSQFIVTPLKFKDQIKRICNSYGMHKEGTLIFFGLDRMYIINKDTKCTAYETNEFTTTYVIANGKLMASSQTGGCYEHSYSKCNLVNAMDINIVNKRELELKKIGNNIVSVNDSGGVIKSGGTTSNVTNVVVQSEGDNTLDAVVVKSAEYIITASFSNIDINMLTPNKQFILTIDGSSTKSTYNGKYNLDRVVHHFTKDGDVFTVNSAAEFSQ